MHRRGSVSSVVSFATPNVELLHVPPVESGINNPAFSFPVDVFRRKIEERGGSESGPALSDDDRPSFDVAAFGRNMGSVAPEQQERWVRLFSKPWHARTLAELAEVDATCASLVSSLDSMPAPVRQDMLRHGTLVHVAPGETLFKQGEPGDAIYIVLGGWAQVRVVADAAVALGSIDPSDARKPGGAHLFFGDPTVINTVGPLEAIGERALQQLFIDMLLRGGGGGGGSGDAMAAAASEGDSRIAPEPPAAAPPARRVRASLPSTALERTQAALAGRNFLHPGGAAAPAGRPNKKLMKRASEARIQGRLLKLFCATRSLPD